MTKLNYCVLLKLIQILVTESVDFSGRSWALLLSRYAQSLMNVEALL
jgi:hypothetical protein